MCNDDIMIGKSCIGNVKSCIRNVKSCIEIINEIMIRIKIMVEIMIWIETTKYIAAQTEPNFMRKHKYIYIYLDKKNIKSSVMMV